MDKFILDINYIRGLTEEILPQVINPETHRIEHTEYFTSVIYLGEDESTIPNGNGYIISYGGILAEIIDLEDDYGEYKNEEEYRKAIGHTLTNILESMYSSTIPSITVMGV